MGFPSLPKKISNDVGKDSDGFLIKDHLGNVRLAISDMKLPANEDTQTRGDAPFYVDEKAVNDYYPFGMLIADDGSDNRSWQAGNYRYGYNGKENDNEVKGDGNQIDYGARIYDPRTARFYSLDPLSQKFPHQSNYLYAANSPIVSVDKKGEFAYAFHYIMTYEVMIELGYSKEIADKVAYYASTYADHPNPNISNETDFIVKLGNSAIMTAFGYDPKLLEYRSEQDKKENTDSQSDVSSAVALHGLQTYWENLEPKVVEERSLNGGEFTNKDKTKENIIGAYEVLGYFAHKGKKIESLSEAELKILSKAFHTIQDVEIHNGGVWLWEHKNETSKKSDHDNVECSLGGNEGQLQNARDKTKKAIEKHFPKENKETETKGP